MAKVMIAETVVKNIGKESVMELLAVSRGIQDADYI